MTRTTHAPADRCALTKCRGVLTLTTDDLGRVHATCGQCARRRAGLCRDCPRPVDGTVGKAVRCAACRRVAERATSNRYHHRHLEARRAHDRIRTKTPSARQRRAATAQTWRQRNPIKVKRANMRQYARRHPAIQPQAVAA